MRASGNNSWELADEGVGNKTDFSKITRKIIVYWPFSILCVAILMSCALIYLYKTNPVYSVKASVLIKDSDKRGGSQGDMISSLQDMGLLGPSGNVNNEQMIITSYPLVEEVVNELQLFLKFSVKENIRDIPLYKSDLPFNVEVENYNFNENHNSDDDIQDYKIVPGEGDTYTISSVKKTWKGIWEVPLQLPFGNLILSKKEHLVNWPKEKAVNLTIQSVSEITEGLIGNLTAEIPNKQTSIINLSLQTTTPQRGTDLLNALIEVYQASTVDDNNRLNDSTLKFINQRLLIVGNELDSIEKKIQYFKQKNQLANLPKQSDVLVDNLSQRNRDLNNQMVQLSMINSMTEYLDANKDNHRVIPASLVISDNTLTQTIETYNRLLSAKERLQLSATSENPVLKNIEEQLERLQKSIRSGLESIKLTLTTGIQKMEQQNSSITGMMREVPAVERTFGDFSRQQSIKKELYLFLLQKREESMLAKSSTLANSRIIAPARAAKAPIKPKRGLILLSSVLIGLLLPFGYDRISSLFNTKIRTKEEITNRTELPIIGEIGNKKDEELMDVLNHPRSTVAEQFRALRTNLQYLFTKIDEKVIMITSTSSGEGKTFISANLAAVFGLADKKVVILELDLRKPKLVSSLGLRAGKGFSQYVIGKADIKDIIIPSKVDKNVFIVPAGAIPPNPSELILHQRTDELFEYLRAHFDVIIIDTTPNIVSDPHLLSKYADVTLYIIRLNYTQKDQLKQINDRFISDKFPKLNLVVNDIKSKRYGGNYYGYNYYGYGDYQEGKENKLKQLLNKKTIMSLKNLI